MLSREYRFHVIIETFCYTCCIRSFRKHVNTVIGIMNHIAVSIYSLRDVAGRIIAVPFHVSIRSGKLRDASPQISLISSTITSSVFHTDNECLYNTFRYCHYFVRARRKLLVKTGGYGERRLACPYVETQINISTLMM